MTDLSKIQADLQRKLHKARPVVAMVEKGELKVLSDAEQKLVDMFPKWTAALEEVRAGRVPTLLGGGEPAQESTPQKTSAVAAAPRGEADDGDGDDEDDMKPLFLAVARELLAADDQSPKQRKILLESHVASLVSTKPLTTAKKELDRVTELRTEIRAGRIERPSKAQLSKVMTFETLKKEVQRWTEYVRSQQTFVREGVEEAIRVIELGSTGSEADHGVGPSALEQDEDDVVSSQHTSEEDESAKELVEDSPEQPHVEEVPVEPLVTPTPAAAPQAALEVEEEEEEEEEESEQAPLGDDDDDDNMFGGFDAVFSVEKQKKQAKKEKAAKTPLPPTPSVTATAAVATATASDAPEPEDVQEAVAVAEPPKKKEIDWSELKCQRNKPRLADLVAAAQAEAARESSPQIANGKSSSAGKPDAPLEFLFLDFGGQQDAAGKKKPSSKRQAPPPAQSPVATSILSAVASRVAKELRYALTNPLVHVRVLSHPTDPLTWCINVSPSEGPMSGVVVPVRMTFTPQYPIAPPVLHSLIDIPHPNIVTVGSQRNTICLEHTTVEAWNPANTAYSLLVHLETFFNDDNFQRDKKTQAASLASRVRFARRDCSRFVATDGSLHTPATPEPCTSVWNGPFLQLPNKVSKDGGLVGPATYTWGHRYTVGGSDGQHSCIRVEALGQQVTCARVDFIVFQSPASSGDGIVSIDLESGNVTFCDRIGEEDATKKVSLATLSTPFGVGQTMQIQLHLSKAPFSAQLVIANAVVARFELPAATFALRPAIVLGSAETQLRCQFSINEDISSTGAVTEAEDERALQCFLSLASPDEAVLGPYVEVLSRSKAGFIPTEVNCSSNEVISAKAIDQVRNRAARLNGRRIDGMIPLCLDADHTRRAIPELKKQLMRLARNPNASTLYDPPFKGTSALFILPAALNDTVRQIQKIVAAPRASPKDANMLSSVRELVVLYGRILHTLAVLASQTPAMATEAATLTPPSSGHILAWSHLLEASWAEVARQALQADGVALDNTDESSFQKYHKGKRCAFLLGVALTHAMRTTSIQRLAEDLSSRNGLPPSDVLCNVVPELLKAPRIATWDAVEEWVGVSIM